MKLNYQKFGNSSRKIIILHGLFGSHRNWLSIAKELSPYFTVYTLDLRNHGNSPHSEEYTIFAMVQDLKEFMKDKSLEKAILMGHSMGGLVAMGFALLYSDKVSDLIVVDIAPKIYPPHHQREFEVFKADISGLKNREEIDAYLSQIHPIQEIRHFLMMNLYHDGNQYQWKINWQVLEKSNYLQDFEFFLDKTFAKNTLFIRAIDSPYITDEDYPTIYKMFPNAEIKKLKGNHWIHYSNQKEFLNTIIDYLKIKDIK